MALKECQQKRQQAQANETRFWRVDEEKIARKVQQGSRKYVDLARAKSEALVNVYSLLKQNIKSCNA